MSILPPQMEMRDAGPEGKVIFTGWASVVETPYEMAGYTEVIRRGAWKRTLSNSPDVSLLVEHTGLPLARTTSETMTLREDRLGLFVEATLDGSDLDVIGLRRKMTRERPLRTFCSGFSWHFWSGHFVQAMPRRSGDGSAIMSGRFRKEEIPCVRAGSEHASCGR